VGTPPIHLNSEDKRLTAFGIGLLVRVRSHSPKMEFSHDLQVRLQSETGVDHQELVRLQDDLVYVCDKLHELSCEETLALPLHDKVNVLRVTAQSSLLKVERITEQLHYLIRYRSGEC